MGKDACTVQKWSKMQLLQKRNPWLDSQGLRKQRSPQCCAALGSHPAVTDDGGRGVGDMGDLEGIEESFPD